nr:FAD-binding oxidoreductase [Actinomycetota bacterium]
TGASFAWIGDSGTWPGGMKALKTGVLAAWHQLEEGVPRVSVRWTGSLTVEGQQPDGPRDASLQPGHHRVERPGIARLEPHLRTPPVAAIYAANDGALDPVAVTGALVHAAHDHGADLVVGVAALSLRLDQGRVVGVDTSAGYISADTVVLAAGADVPVLCAALGVHVPVTPSPAIRMHFAAPAGVVKTVFATPDVEVRESAGGGLLASVRYRGEVTSDDLAETGQRITGAIKSMFHGLEDVRLHEARVGMRPMPSDGAPIIGPISAVPGLYVAVMHSGVTLAPLVGSLIAREVVDATETPELGGCRPGRFAERATRASRDPST